MSVVVTFSNGALTDAAPVRVGSTDFFGGTVTITATATDDSGMRSTEVRVANTLLSPLPGNSTARYGGTFTPTASGALIFVVRACDALGNCGVTNIPLTADMVAPTAVVAAPTPMQRVRLNAPVDATATDMGSGVASLSLAGFAGFVDANAASERIQGTWGVPSTTPEGVVTAIFTGCDVVGNCRNTLATVYVDRTPPVTTVTATWGSSSKAPVVSGVEQYVAGLVTLTATSSDLSGLSSATVSEGATTIVTATGAGAASVTGAFDTTTSADGLRTFVANACDSLGNCGDTTYVVTADNTAPTYKINNPRVATYGLSSPVPVDIFVQGTERLAAPIALSGLQGFVDGDTSPARIAGNWVPSPSTPSGPRTASVAGCDIVDNCRSTPVPFVLDLQPPAVTALSGPPRYTKVDKLTPSDLSVNVVDAYSPGPDVFVSITNPAGVETIQPLGQSTGAPISLAQNYSLPTEGDYIVRVYGVDRATPTGNSGRNAGVGPHLVQWTVTVDRTPPVVTFVNRTSTFRPENGLVIGSNPDGTMAVPVQYQYVQGPLDLFVPGTNIAKAANRLSWGPSQPTAAVLEGANPRNTPYLQFATTTAQAAPIVTADYRFLVTDCGYPCVAPMGTLWQPLQSAVAVQPGFNTYNALIASETLPQLLQPLGSSIQWIMDVNITDAAGNVGVLSTDERITTLQPAPVHVWRDPNYETRGDSKSFFTYRVANNTYPALFDPNNAQFSADNYVRFARYIVSNPGQDAAAVRPNKSSGGTSVTTAESWGSERYDFGLSGDVFTHDGFSFSVRNDWDTISGSTFVAQCGFQPANASPCGAGTDTTQFPFHQLGSSAPYACRALNQLPPATFSANLNVMVSPAYYFRAFKNPVTAPTGVETVVADPVGTGFLVPAGGAIAVYATLPRQTMRSRPLIFQGNPNAPAAPSRYQFWYADMWRPTTLTGYTCVPAQVSSFTRVYQASHWWEYLQGAGTTATVEVAFSSAGATPSGTTIGPFNLSSTISHALDFTQ